MDDREALIAGIAADPDDDLRRLVFADWLDDHGEPERAEFVRLQVELQRIEDREERLVAIARANELFREHGRRWFAPFLSALDPVGPKSDYRLDTRDDQCQTDIDGDWWEGPPASSGERDTEERAFVSRVSVERGFAAQVNVTLSALPAGYAVATALRREPVTTLSASLSFDGREWERFTSPELARVSAMYVYGSDESEWRTVFADPNLGAVGWLGVHMDRHFDEPDVPLSPAIVREFHNSRLGRQVTSLDVVVDDSGLRALAEAGELALESLFLIPPWQCDWADGAAAFLNSPVARALKTLHYGWGSVGDTSLIAFGRGTELRRLEHLQISLNEVSERGLRALAEAEVMTRLEYLEVNFSDWQRPPTDDTLRGLLHLPDSNRNLQVSLLFQSAREVPAFLREKFGDRLT